ncbi:MAG: V-type ATP synthase subunit F [Clostridia bacterium]|nr:V-type ATP synthase subunit F [Clostridia bacterium]
MYKIAVIGSSDTVIGFKALGLDTFPVNSDEEAAAAFKQIFHAEEDKPYAIVYVEETWAEGLSTAMSKFRSDPAIAFILIPGREGPKGLGRKALHDAVEKAVGSDITGE